MTIWAIDPGPHTGIFYVLYGLGQFRYNRVTLDYTDSLVQNPHENLHLWLMQNVNPSTDEVVYEPFEFRKEERDREYIDYTTGEYVGVIALYCQQTGTPSHRQMASQVMSFWTDDKLKRVGLYVPGKEHRHERDATRHWLHHDTFTKGNQEWLHKLKK